MEYRVSWTGETCTATTKRLRIESFHSDTENLLLQIDDGTDLGVWVTRITILLTADPNGYQTWPLSTAEWDLGEPLIRFIGATESGDTTQTDLSIDHLHILCELIDYEAETRYDWSGVDTTGDSWTLIVNCQREIFPDDTESLLIQVLTPPGTWNTRYTCDQEVDTVYNTYALTSAELNGGAPALRFLDANQAEDQFDTDWWIDVALIRRDYTVGDDGGPGPGGGGQFFSASCRQRWFDLVCHLDLDPRVVGVNLERTDWFVDGEYRASGTGDGRRHEAVLRAPYLLHEANVTVVLYLTNGGIYGGDFPAVVNNLWVIALIVLAVTGIALIDLWHRAQRRHQAQRKEGK
jgi:hypothetical protein